MHSSGVSSRAKPARPRTRQEQSAKSSSCSCSQFTPCADKFGAGAPAEMRTWRAHKGPPASQPPSVGKTPVAGANLRNSASRLPDTLFPPEGGSPYKIRATESTVGRSQCPPALGFLRASSSARRALRSFPYQPAVCWRSRELAPRRSWTCELAPRGASGLAGAAKNFR